MKNIRFIFAAFTLLFVFSQVNAQETSTSINNVVIAYYGVKNALTADNSTAAQSSAKVLMNAIAAVPMDKMTADQHNAWMAYTDKLQYDSRHISENGALDHQREHFSSLSKNLYEVLKGLKINTTTIYEQYCPMKKATWLSETAAIKNPYYGNQMLSCGKTTETIAPVNK